MRVLSALFKRVGRNVPAVEKVEVGRQSHRVDVWAVVNERIPVIIEDKVGTFQHSDQLERYLATARAWGAR